MKIIAYFSFYLSKISKIPLLTILSLKLIFVSLLAMTPSLCTRALSSVTWIATLSAQILGATGRSSWWLDCAAPKSKNRDAFFTSDVDRDNNIISWFFYIWFCQEWGCFSGLSLDFPVVVRVFFRRRHYCESRVVHLIVTTTCQRGSFVMFSLVNGMGWGQCY